MTDFCSTPFGTYAQLYKNLGYWPRPLTGKACKIPGWQMPDSELAPETLEKWIREFPDANIGLVMGSPFPDGTLLGALDVDHDHYRKLALACLGHPPCARFGSKGVVIIVRHNKNSKNKKIKASASHGPEYGQVAEFLFHKSLCVIPPSIHPDTKNPYKWIGTPLHEINYQDLPLIGE